MSKGKWDDGTYDDGYCDIIAVPPALLGSVEGRTRVQTVVALRADTEPGNIDRGVWKRLLHAVGLRRSGRKMCIRVDW